MREQVGFKKRDALRRVREPTADPELCPLLVRQPARVPTHVLLYVLAYCLAFQLAGAAEHLEAQMPTEPIALQLRALACRVRDRGT